jgi:hypothetical protein
MQLVNGWAVTRNASCRAPRACNGFKQV